MKVKDLLTEQPDVEPLFEQATLDEVSMLTESDFGPSISGDELIAKLRGLANE